MKKLLSTACTSFALVALLVSSGAFAQKAKPVKAETVSVAPVKAAALPKAETITSTLKPLKAASSSKVSTTATTLKPATTTIKTSKLAPTQGVTVPDKQQDSLKEKGTVRVMTHEQIEKMMAEKALVMKGMLNKPAPAFLATDLNGKIYQLDKLKGKTVVLNFWFIGCKPCVMEMPHLNKLVEKYGKEDIVFIAFALDDKAALEKFLTKKSFEYNIIPDAGKVSHDTFKVSAFPTSIIIDKKGIVQDYLIGYSEDVDKQLTAFIDKALLVK